MKVLLPLFSLAALGSTLPTWHQGPIISDDDTLMERRDMVKIEIVQAHSPFTNTVVTKITKYASDARGFLSESFKGAVADSNGEVAFVSYGKKMAPFMTGKISGTGHRSHHRHRISLLGFRNRLAVFILAFSLVLAVACSYFRRIYVASLQPQEADAYALESVLSEKGRSHNSRTDEMAQS
ncbi:hypothetical protein QQS21_006078 [Conoideocrella luteorostrata]|uniref:Uncharacterized protein n=1 Tax=Conoideocrella luteorostrata TaxID=1105319 RepID=A0AAJ0CQN1_9HYPO|nr:hypothetical protein QQS21_006078 [Conoideocrella luteorostrata]